MAEPSSDLTGVWQGRYAYPLLGLDVPFTATLLDFGGTISGTTHEEDALGVVPQTLFASLSGRRTGEAVRFLKRYENAPETYGTVLYEGELRDDGHEIAGRWSVAGWTGAFLMVRPRRRTQQETRRQAERA